MGGTTLEIMESSPEADILKKILKDIAEMRRAAPIPQKPPQVIGWQIHTWVSASLAECRGDTTRNRNPSEETKVEPNNRVARVRGIFIVRR